MVPKRDSPKCALTEEKGEPHGIRICTVDPKIISL